MHEKLRSEVSRFTQICSFCGTLSLSRLGFSQPVKTGACGLALLITQTSLVVANAGDCKAVSL